MSLKSLIAISLAVFACCSHDHESKAQAAAPPRPACTFQGNIQSIFCTGQFGEKCFVCLKNRNEVTECWPFERQRCYKP